MLRGPLHLLPLLAVVFLLAPSQLWPLLTSDDFPKGRLQPYAGGGPGLFFADAEADFRPKVPFMVDDSGMGVGVDARAGPAWQFHPRLALFGEYRYTLAKLDTADVFPESGSRAVETTFKTHHVLVGLSLRF